MQARGEVEGRLDTYWSSASQGETDSGVRKTCKSCENFMPMGADITVAVAGEKNIGSECRMFFNTVQSMELVSVFGGKER